MALRENKNKSKKQKFLVCAYFCGINTLIIVSFKVSTWCHWREFRGNVNNQLQCNLPPAHRVRLILQWFLECEQHHRVSPNRWGAGLYYTRIHQSSTGGCLGWRIWSPQAPISQRQFSGKEFSYELFSAHSKQPWEISASVW